MATIIGVTVNHHSSAIAEAAPVKGTIEEVALAEVVTAACVNPAGVDVVVYVVTTAEGGEPKGEVTLRYNVDRMVIVEICVTGGPGGLNTVSNQSMNIVDYFQHTLEDPKGLGVPVVQLVLVAVVLQTALNHIWRPLVLPKGHHLGPPYHILCIGSATVVAYCLRKQVPLCRNCTFHRDPAQPLLGSLVWQLGHIALQQTISIIFAFQRRNLSGLRLKSDIPLIPLSFHVCMKQEGS
jgi:hypothetical protein